MISTIKGMGPGKRRAILFVVILLLGVFLRLWHLGQIPGKGALNQDEAFSAYEAWSLLSEGVDSDGYPFPVYFAAWGSGMNALQSYCMIPCIAILGLNSLAIRLPQALLGILTLLAFYGFCRQGGERRGLMGMLVLAVMPWHIMASRWALESNMLPGLLLLAEACVLGAVRRPRLMVLAAALFALSLYAYSAAWIVMPPLILLSAIWLIRRNRAALRCLPAAILVMAVIALPLLLFALVNCGIIDEIVTPWISIPKLGYFRSGDVSFRPGDMLQRLLSTLKMLARQNDGRKRNAFFPYGLYYFFAVPFGLYGGISALVNVFSRRREPVVSPSVRGERDCESLMLIWLACGFALSLLIPPNINRLNILHIPIIYFIALGLSHCVEQVRGHRLRAGVCVAIVAALLASVTLFFHAYCTTQNDRFARRFHQGLAEAVAATGDASVVVSDKIFFPEILLYDRISPTFFVENRQFYDDSARFRKLRTCGRFTFADDAQKAAELWQDCDFIICTQREAERYQEALGDTTFVRMDHGYVTVLSRKPLQP